MNGRGKGQRQEISLGDGVRVVVTVISSQLKIVVKVAIGV